MPLKTLLRTLVTCLALAVPAAAQTAQDAREAYNSGDYATALTLAAPLSDGGDPVAQNVMALLYEEGLAGLPLDIARAMELYEASAAAGWWVAQRNLGTILRDGIPGVPADPQRALALMTKAHEQGQAAATLDLAHMYWDGVGTEVDLVEARRLLEIAAAQNDDNALNDLGVLFEDGLGGSADLDRAKALYRQAAELGNPLGGLNVATLMLADEAITPEAQIEAVAWCLWAQARAAGDEFYEESVAEDCAAVVADAEAADLDAAKTLADSFLARF